MSKPLSSLLLPGTAMPALAFGTLMPGVAEEDRVAAVLCALEHGFRHIDTAADFGTETAVGKAMRLSGLPRDDVCVSTKLWNDMHAPEDVEKSLDASLARLGLGYVDVLLMHWPVAFKRSTIGINAAETHDRPTIDAELSSDHRATWKAMEAMVLKGKARAIGVANFSISQLDKLLQGADLLPAMNQVEAHPLWPQDELLRYCQAKGIALVAHGPLGSQMGQRSEAPLMQDWRLVSAADRARVDIAQMLLAWGLQRGTGVIVKSVRPDRIKENFSVVEVPEEALAEVSGIVVDDPSRSKRYVDFSEEWQWCCFEEST